MIRLIAVLIFLGGLALPLGSMSDAKGGLLVAFFGLMAAGIIPAMSLLVANTLSPSFSVKRLDELKREVGRLLAKLGQTLGFVIAGSVLVIVAQFDLPVLPPRLFDLAVPDWVRPIAERMVQAGAFSCFIVALDRLRVVNAAFSSVFRQRYEIARKDSEVRTKGNVRRIGTAKEFFQKKDQFGETIEISPEKAS